MKIILLVIVLISNYQIFAQDDEIVFPRNEKGDIAYQSVIEIENVNKNELFERARLFVANYYKSAKTVIDYSDKETGQIIIKPIFGAKVKAMGNTYTVGKWNYNFTILTKDNKYKFVIGDFFEEKTSDCLSVGHLETSDENTFALGCPTKRQLKQMKYYLHNDVITLIKSFNEAMSKQVNNDF